MNIESKTRNMVLAAVFLAIIVFLAFTPFGYIPLGFMNATIIHVPVIIGAVFLGPKYGGFLGLVFGLTSLWKNTYMPNATSFVFSPFITIGDFGGNFWSLVICLVPRILIGVVAYYVFCAGMKLLGKRTLSLAAAGVAGSLTNTLLVMNLIYLFFGEQYGAAARGITDGIYGVIMGIICINGIPEAIVAAILSTAIAQALFKAMRK
ncbi:MAG TPA: ECF transporter S component [Candidatus Hungatella pullicola]|nr:ECF transporter S component [Candidatus Hungatella pullicola]